MVPILGVTLYQPDAASDGRHQGRGVAEAHPIHFILDWIQIWQEFGGHIMNNETNPTFFQTNYDIFHATSLFAHETFSVGNGRSSFQN